MAVDRGGLQYTIAVRDQFSATTKRFRKELGASKKAFRDFQSSIQGNKAAAKSIRDASKATKELTTGQKAVAALTKKVETALKGEAAQRKRIQIEAKRQLAVERESVKLRAAASRDAAAQARVRERALRREQVQLKANADAIKAQERRVVALRKAQQRELADRIRSQNIQAAQSAKLRAATAKDAAARDRGDPKIQAQKQLNRELFREQVIREKIKLLRTRARSQFASGDFLGGSKSLKNARAMERSLNGMKRAANGLLFSFRRLVGVLAVFTLARRAVQAFNDLVKSGVAFNDRVAQAEVGVAGLVSTLGDVRTELGASVGQAEELDLALGLAREQMFLLRQDSLRTTATFGQLLETFQVAIGPGFAAGLKLDEIRQLTVQISQAATALQVPQNQLAEEIRSLLAGTIQARTTRIATSLGITNSDIRRLKETGELFDFLNEKLEGFALAAERQARETLGGIRTLVLGATQELLGKAALPLFEELISLGNQIFDEFLTISDAAGNIRPNPEAVAAFQEIFEAIRIGVVRARELGEELGFEGLQSLLAALGTGLLVTFEFLAGVLDSVLTTFIAISDVIGGFGGAIGASNKDLGKMAGFAGQALVAFIAIRKVTLLLGLDFAKIRALSLSAFTNISKLGPVIQSIAVGPVGLLAAAIGIVLLGFEKLFERIFDVDVSIRDTIQLIALGLAGAFNNVGSAIAKVGLVIVSSLGQAIDDVITRAKLAVTEAQAFGDALLGGPSQAASDKRFREQEDLQLAADKRRLARANELRLRLEDVELKRLANLAGLEAQIAATVGERAGAESQGEGFDPTIDPSKFDEAAASVSDFTGFVSTADQEVAALAASLLKLSDAQRAADLQFGQAGTAPAQGFGGQVQGIFNTEEQAQAERVQQISTAIKNIRDQIALVSADEVVTAERRAAIEGALATSAEDRAAALGALELTEDEGRLVSLLRDESDLRDGLLITERASLDLAITKAAVAARQLTPQLQQENALLASQAAAERAITQAQALRLPQRQQELVVAQNALNIAQAEAEIRRQQQSEELAAVGVAAGQASGEERAAIMATIAALEMRNEIEGEITANRLEQLRIAQEEAALAADGSLTDGLRRGFEGIVNTFGSTFNAGVEIARQGTQALADFIAQEIQEAFDPNSDSTLEERFAMFMQTIANLIFQQLIQLAIASALQALLGKTAESTIEIASATTAATIKTTAATVAAGIEINAAIAAAAIKAASGGGFSTGGFVHGFAQGGMAKESRRTRAQGFAKGGRPAHISHLDTIPAFLRPGEFVVRPEAVAQPGMLHNLQRINAGGAPVMESSAAAAGAAQIGMQGGGFVSAQLQQQGEEAALRSSESEGGGLTVVPAVVAGEREMSQLNAGGRNAQLRFIQDNAGTIGSILDKRRR